MTKRALAIALAAVGVIVLATTAAAAPTLSLRTAERLAKRVALKEVRGRHIVAFHVSRPHRRSAREIDFAYNDRSRTNVYCTARLVVRITNVKTGSADARISHPTCAPIPAAALAFEATTARALKQVHARRAAVNASLHALARRLRACATLGVPRRERAAVRLIAGAGSLEALSNPVATQVASFVTSLVAIKTTTPPLAAAQVAWADYLVALRTLPALPDPCASVKRWAGRHYGSPAPVDIATLARLNARMTLDARRIAAGAKVLHAVGVFPRDVVGFTPAGLLLQLKIKSFVIR